MGCLEGLYATQKPPGIYMTAKYDFIECLFCKFSLKSSAKDKNYTRIFTDYDCEACHAEFVVDEDSQQIVHYSLIDGDYKLQINLLSRTCEVRKGSHYWTYINRGPTYHANWHTILTIPCLPGNVTPANVGSKIKTFLLFS